MYTTSTQDRVGGETRRKTAIALAVVFAVILMPAQPVAADTLQLTVPDGLGDVAINYDVSTYDVKTLLSENMPIVKAGYFDMALFWFGLDGDTYTFGMKLAADLPQPGTPLPAGIGLLQYTLWLDEDWWDWVSDVPSYCMIVFRYDGLTYSAALLDWPSEEVVMALPFTVEGPMFEVEFSADSIGNIPAFWLYAGVIIYRGNCPNKMWTDGFDYDAGAPGQVITSIPWPPAES